MSPPSYVRDGQPEQAGAPLGGVDAKRAALAGEPLGGGCDLIAPAAAPRDVLRSESPCSPTLSVPSGQGEDGPPRGRSCLYLNGAVRSPFSGTCSTTESMPSGAGEIAPAGQVAGLPAAEAAASRNLVPFSLLSSCAAVGLGGRSGRDAASRARRNRAAHSRREKRISSIMEASGSAASAASAQDEGCPQREEREGGKLPVAAREGSSSPRSRSPSFNTLALLDPRLDADEGYRGKLGMWHLMSLQRLQAIEEVRDRLRRQHARDHGNSAQWAAIWPSHKERALLDLRETVRRIEVDIRTYASREASRRAYTRRMLAARRHACGIAPAA